MNLLELVQYLIVAENAVIIALISVFGGLMVQRQKSTQKDAQTIAKQRSNENLLSMRFMSANTNLSIVTAMAVQNQKINGQMDAALKAAKEAQQAYYDYINELGADKVAGLGKEEVA